MLETESAFIRGCHFPALLRFLWPLNPLSRLYAVPFALFALLAFNQNLEFET